MNKVIIRLPDEEVAAIEQIRRRRRAIRRYEEAYRRHPERAEAAAFAKVAVCVLGKERW